MLTYLSVTLEADKLTSESLKSEDLLIPLENNASPA